MPNRRITLPSLLTSAVLLAGGLLGTAPAQSLPTGAERLAPERYPDVPPEHWAQDAIRRLSVLGVLTGYPDETFRGERFATRYELAVVAARLVDLIGGSLADLALDPAFWSDIDRVAEMLGRLERVESAIENAASTSRVQELERRVADVEAFLNELAGEQRFPAAVGEPTPLSAAETVPPPEGTPAAQARSGEAGLGEAGPPAGGGRNAASAGGAAGLGASGAGAGLGALGTGERRPLDWWLGVAAGYPVPATFHVGLRDLWPSVHLRGGLGFGGAGGYAAEVLALVTLPAAVDAPLLPYLGAGPAISGAAGGTSAGMLALVGLEVPLGRSLQAPGLIYLELGPRVLFGEGMDLDVLGRAGIGYRF